MPIYEYACQNCGHEFEALVRSDTVPVCPDCQSTELEKRLSVFATTTSEAALIPSSPCASCPNAGAGPGGCGMN
ncbi:zinc ribbon domain-containing protein [Rhodoferax sp.]|uniref:FmdB family zinc ribbon protein n=1 Tax=Rhodoferax sp. TaxID=50421 RepID=UPI00262D7DEF|nr:zinc ribbon domain-containing protein [Rhodoferax sp.]MDD2924210.1 zinc ribbon domain-containing protein [Rhodoferax sp.]